MLLRATTGAEARVDVFERASRILTLTAFAVAALIAFAAPVLALSWSRQPFPGFMIGQTLLVNERIGPDWSGRLAGMDFPQQVTRVAGIPVRTPLEYNRVIFSLEAGEQIPIITRLPDGTVRLYPSVRLSVFTSGDLLRLFWLPYLIGLAYLAIGVWIYLARGKTRPARALAFFCACMAITAGLLFDVLTTHLGTAIWAVALAQLGGAVISLSLRFPEEWKPVAQRSWLLAVPYLVSIGLSIGWLLTFNDVTRPWAYVSVRSLTYAYVAFGGLFFMGMTLYRARTSAEPVARQQGRLVLVGSFIGFTPVIVWFVAAFFGIRFIFNSALLLPGLLLFPLSVAVAIIRYRLLDVDEAVNRTIVYAVLTAVVTGLYSALIGLSQRLFVAITGQESDAAIIITTLIVVSFAADLKGRVQTIVDRRFREVPGHMRDLRAFGDQVHAFMQMRDNSLLARRLLEEAADDLHAESGAVILFDGEGPPTRHTIGQWRGQALVSVPLAYEGHQYGLLMLGPRRYSRPYSRRDVDTLHQVAGEIGHALAVSR